MHFKRKQNNYSKSHKKCTCEYAVCIVKIYFYIYSSLDEFGTGSGGSCCKLWSEVPFDKILNHCRVRQHIQLFSVWVGSIILLPYTAKFYSYERWSLVNVHEQFCFMETGEKLVRIKQFNNLSQIYGIKQKGFPLNIATFFF